LRLLANAPKKQKRPGPQPGLFRIVGGIALPPRESTHQGSTPIMSAAMNTNAAQIIKALIGRVSPMA
jgi:hypothetical protein